MNRVSRVVIDLISLRWVMLAGLSLAILSAKFLTIKAFGSITPFWDQWDGEGDGLYRNYVEHSLSLDMLLSSHNEHRIFLTRIYNLLIFEFVGHWDPILQMLLNAILHTAAVCLAVRLLFGHLPRPLWFIGACMAALCTIVPFGWENTLAGFQSQFYLMVLCSIISIGLMTSSPVRSARWLLGFGSGALGFLTLASGFLVLPAVAGCMVLQMLLGQRSGRLELWGIAAVVFAAAIFFPLVPDLPYHRELKAHSLAEFRTAFTMVASWPLSWGTLGIVLLHAPGLALFVRILRERPPARHVHWIMLATLGWVALQYASAAYSRAASPAASRYLDLYSFGLIVNLAILLTFCAERTRSGGAHTESLAAFLWIVVTTVSLAQAARLLPPQIEERASWGVAHTSSVSEFLRTGQDAAILSRSGPAEIPYPSPARLLSWLKNPTIRRFLPPELTPNAAPGSRASRVLTSERWTGMALRFKRWLLGLGLPLAVLSAAVLLLSVLGWCVQRRTPQDTPSCQAGSAPRGRELGSLAKQLTSAD